MIRKLLGWFFGLIISVLGILNICYGNDADFGVFLILISLVFYPPTNLFIKNRFRWVIPVWIKVLLAIFLIWANLAVGALAEGYVF